MIEPNRPVIYRINRDDKIEFVNDAWSRFAFENDAVRLTDRIIGTSLWDHIVGPDVTQIYRDLLWRIRTQLVSATLPFRCDSPVLARVMQLVVIPLEREAVEFQATLHSEAPHPKAIELLRHGHVAASGPFIRMCAWCKAIAINGNWKPLEEAVESEACLLQEPFPQITHAICDPCFVKLS